MKISEFVNNVLDKDMLINLISRSNCEVCPFKMACRDSAIDNSEETCEQFLDRWIEDDRNEGQKALFQQKGNKKMKVNMKVYSKSIHLLLDRRNRYEYIESHTGFGQPIAKFFDLEHDTVNVITDTGVLMGMNSNETKLITVFYPTLRQAERMARENGLFLTKKIVETIVKNEIMGLIAGQPEQKGKN